MSDELRVAVLESDELPEPEGFAWARAGCCVAIVHRPGYDRRVIAAVAAAAFSPPELVHIRQALGIGSG